MDRFPQPSLPASFRLWHLVRLRVASNRWRYSLSAAFCVAAPVVFGWCVGDIPAGLVASIGTFAALYGADRPYSNRAMVLAATAVGLACAVGLGAWSQPFGRLGIATVVLIATCATFLCNALRIGPPGAYMFALGGAIGTSLPSQHLDWWHAALLVLAGGGFSTVVRVVGVLVDARRPERTSVASAGTAVARFLKTLGGPDEDATRHTAAVTLHDTWTTLVSRQPARSANDGTLRRLRSISRELHRLFVAGINAGGRFADRDALAARAHELAAEALSNAAAVKREEPEHVPLGKHGAAEALRESLVWPSPTLVASLRVGLATAIAASVGAALDLERAYWIVAAAVLIVHQGWDWNRSLRRGFERIVGTLLGLALAGAALWLAPQGLWLALTLAVLQLLICMLVVQNYALAVIFITAAAITMASGGHPVENIAELLWARAIDTIIGCAIGIGVLLVTATRVGRSDPPRTRGGSGCGSGTAQICRRRRCGFPQGQTVSASPATQSDRAHDGVRPRRWGAATRPPFRRGTVARRGGRTTRPLSVACILLDIGRSRQRWIRQRSACCIRSHRTSQPERRIGGSFQCHNSRSDCSDIL